ncbi:PH domain-containing protein [Salinicoccus hispanicus]|uniref:Uncharacterized protein YyaB-like PH domain-containing protein n=1 Tax=Salinicoccus hispanicus TaxID=157225 RepID=A0A6N8U159_9STAP|nr:PH domain-containing protein [Salinicoccus hispanicus]MXQ50105.1 hypothetical protein [Salinicoccus hispanicus]
MIFRSKIDTFYTVFMSMLVIIIGLVSFLPLFLDDAPILAIILLTSMFFITLSFLLWMSFSIKYIFNEDHLFVESGPFKIRIPYENITKVTPTTAVLSGHRILSSRDAIEIYNRTTFWGSIKISPKDKKSFIAELASHCPNLKVEL